MPEQKQDWWKVVSLLLILVTLANVLVLDYVVGKGKDTSGTTAPLGGLEERIASLVTRQQALESAVTDIATFSALPVALPTTAPSVVEKTVVERVVTQAPSSTVKEFYIPLGQAAAQTENFSWVDTGAEATFDIANYGSVKEVNFEATLSSPEGQVEVRLYNVSDKNAIYGSTIVGDAQDPKLYRSSNLVLPGGQKTYRVQMRTSVKVLATMHSGRIRILLK
ncbi:MAG: hypothetical protein A2900_04795 [Candidatus Chisholmbacteria bacterium RIFCSPLOWO2_01_FULL_50_28]|uniref:Uncharacterized protein n=1 Tax=Candidatus Chisholmbacteria bacterium RIFCSPHIGHO2_01_FULL_52_32 TaxID=1797591 RepID=A0A1G1VS92_9BACT|nr:MAG: hypothetical protein A2786_01950 [Candidatus Chisholmbacteria bacterium RIFCSPHIGHO2_01_FULL_52_32]OGY20365.1 MAG: hypothetical protein A2900_04795 [Candidatus Chisholmbacteria bacterium RIFCSPLOWO2_01_FULL_50_28]